MTLAASADERFVGVLVVVTGGSRGIGRAVASRFAADGAQVVSLDLQPTGQTSFQEIRCDVADQADVARAFAELERDLGSPAVLVNNAGVNASFDPVELSVEEWDRFMAVDLRSSWLCARSALRAMRQARTGSIVNVSSIHATMTQRGMFPYAVAKSGLTGLTRSLALECAPFGVRVNSVSPGYTRTRLVDDWLRTQEPGMRAQLDALHPLGRICEPHEVAAAVAFLAGPDASAITGTELMVDCGLSIRMPV